MTRHEHGNKSTVLFQGQAHALPEMILPLNETTMHDDHLPAPTGEKRVLRISSYALNDMAAVNHSIFLSRRFCVLPEIGPPCRVPGSF